MKHFVTEGLIAAAKTFEERGKVYGDGYKKHGKIMKALFPSGLTLESADDFTRFGVFNAMVAKLNRYSENFENGGHADSVHDLAVFAIMQLDVDNDSN